MTDPCVHAAEGDERIRTAAPWQRGDLSFERRAGAVFGGTTQP